MRMDQAPYNLLSYFYIGYNSLIFFLFFFSFLCLFYDSAVIFLLAMFDDSLVFCFTD